MRRTPSACSSAFLGSQLLAFERQAAPLLGGSPIRLLLVALPHVARRGGQAASSGGLTAACKRHPAGTPAICTARNRISQWLLRQCAQ